MKRILSILLVISLCILSVSALAEGSTVTAIGSATVSLVPDMATFSVGVTTQDALITAAQSANTTAMQSIIDAMVTLGVAREDLQTDQYSVYPVYDYKSDSPVITGYEVNNIITVIVRKLDDMPSLLDAAVEAGANNVYSLNFQSSQRDAAYDQALKAAAQDALRKASLIAQAVGTEAGTLITLTENPVSGSQYVNDIRALSLDSSYAVPIENGVLTVSAEVSATVALQ